MTAAQSNALTLFQLFDAKAQPFLTAYDASFNKALSIIGNEGAYAEEFIYYPTALTEPNVQLVRVPVPLSAPELRLFKGRNRFVENGNGYMELQKAPYQEGVSEFLTKINAADWIGFSIAPEVYAGLVNAWPSQQSVSQLGTAENTLAWHGVTNFLATLQYSNPYNPKMKIPGSSSLATYQNWWPNTIPTTTSVQAMRADMIKRRGFDNRPLGYRGTHLVSSPDLYPIIESIAEDDRLANGATNPVVKFKLKPTVWYDLPPKRWGLVHLDKNRPIFTASKGSPVTKVYGIESAMYERQRKVGWDVYVELAKGLGRQESISIADTG